ncbi:MAG TPA: thioredoxin family protein [Saprospiraceae bacterium]|nr:thioredoxin family protein [Saprospiraceae bacterium]
MALKESNMLALGTTAPFFRLQDTITNMAVSLDDFMGSKALVLMFICNHCPYVLHVNDQIIKLAKEYLLKGVRFVAISSNDVVNYPDDSPEKMHAVGLKLGYPFPYLYDETQKVAQEYDAACTPDFYVFDEHLKLVYRGQLDDSRPNSEIPVTGKDLRDALDAILNNAEVNPIQRPSAGCNIKLKN